MSRYASYPYYYCPRCGERVSGDWMTSPSPCSAPPVRGVRFRDHVCRHPFWRTGDNLEECEGLSVLVFTVDGLVQGWLELDFICEIGMREKGVDFMQRINDWNKMWVFKDYL